MALNILKSIEQKIERKVKDYFSLKYVKKDYWTKILALLS
jgi:hypothetical protein